MGQVSSKPQAPIIGNRRDKEMNKKQREEKAKKLAVAGRYRKACEILFGTFLRKQAIVADDAKAMKPTMKPNFELVEGFEKTYVLGKTVLELVDGSFGSFCTCLDYMKHQEHWDALGCSIMLFSDFYALLNCMTQDQIESLREDMKSNWIVTSLFRFDGLMLSADGREPVDCKEYDGFAITEVDEPLLQYIFDTTDAKAVIIQKLCEFSGMIVKNIHFWTPKMFSRSEYKSRAACFDYYDGGFHVYGNCNLNNYGRSRGVRVVARRASAEP